MAENQPWWKFGFGRKPAAEKPMAPTASFTIGGVNITMTEIPTTGDVQLSFLNDELQKVQRLVQESLSNHFNCGIKFSGNELRTINSEAGYPNPGNKPLATFEGAKAICNKLATEFPTAESLEYHLRVVHAQRKEKHEARTDTLLRRQMDPYVQAAIDFSQEQDRALTDADKEALLDRFVQITRQLGRGGR